MSKVYTEEENKKLIDKYNGIAMGNKEKPYVYLT